MKNTIKLIVLAAILVSVVALTACVHIGSSYDHADQYTAGDRDFSEPVNKLDINWSSGTVTVMRHDSDVISIKETCNKSLKDDEKVHSWLDGSTLRIQFCKSGEVFSSSAEKKLEILIPKNLKLSDIFYDGSSADANFEDLSANNVTIESSSGDIRMVNCQAKEYAITASSGDIKLDQIIASEKAKCTASSGEISINTESISDLSVETSSGDVKLDIKDPHKVYAQASSGEMNLTFAKMPSELKIETSSGDVDLYLPKNADFKAEIETSSGDFESDLALSKNGDTYTCGNGEASVSIETSSGDIKIMKYN